MPDAPWTGDACSLVDAFRAGGRDARLMRQLADARRLEGIERARLGSGAAELLGDWLRSGWLHEETE